MAVYTYPNNYELTQILPDLLDTTELNDPIFNLFPIRTSDSSTIMWEIKDNTTGLQGVRGLNGQPNRVTPMGGKRFAVKPGVYGDVQVLDEFHITERRQPGTPNTPIDLSDLIMVAEVELANRMNDRIRQVLWTLAATGTFSVVNKLGQVEYTDTFSTQTYTAGITWATSATATPLANLRAAKLLGRGHSADFGPKATAYMNLLTFNYLVSNSNASDLFGRRTNGLATIGGLDDINAVNLKEGLPTIVIFDDVYLNDNGTAIPFIADNKVILVGVRPRNQPVGAYIMTRNASNPNSEPGVYSFVKDSLSDGNNPVPREIAVHLGHNGAPVIYYPSAVIRMNV